MLLERGDYFNKHNPHVHKLGLGRLANLVVDYSGTAFSRIVD